MFADLHERGHAGVRGGAWSDHSPGTLPSQHFERGGQSHSLLRPQPKPAEHVPVPDG